MATSAWAKRVFDLAVSVPLLIASVPVQVVTALAVARRLGRPVLFRQRRPGRYGRPFELLKFRSMRPVDPAMGHTDDASRLTTFGRWLRASSLDELPSLWNVVRGDMSLVGPRPLLLQYLPLYTPQQARRHQVRPGLTGLAQITGRNEISWEEKLALDVRYVDTRSMRMDLSILAATVRVVIGRRGVSASGQATMTEFTGTAAPSGRVVA